MVGLDPEGDDLVGVPAVRPDGQHRGDPLDARFGEGAGVAQKPRLEAAQPAVACRPGADLEKRRRRRIAHPEVLVPGQLDADRSAEDEGGGRGQRIDDEVLAAERATERRAGHPDRRHRPAEQASQLPARVEGALRRAGEVEDAVLVDRGRRDLRLQVALVDPARREPSLDDDVAVASAASMSPRR